MGLNATMLDELSLTEASVSTAIAEITRGVFSTMAMMAVVDGPPLTEPVKKFYETITSMVGFAGSYSGILSVHCSRKLAILIASNMLGMEIAEINDDVKDAMGEIANMIGGDVKHIFSPKGGDICLSIPTVIDGTDYCMSSADSLVIPFWIIDHQILVSVKVRRQT